MKLRLIAAALFCIALSAIPVQATPIEFTFSGVITLFSASVIGQGSLPNLALPGDLFTGSAFFDSDMNPEQRGSVGFSINVNGFLWKGVTYIGHTGGPQHSTLTDSDLYIETKTPDFGGPYSTSSTSLHATSLSLSLLSGTGSFVYFGDNCCGTDVHITGNVTSAHRVPEPSSLALLLPGILGVVLVRRAKRGAEGKNELLR